MMVEKTLDVLSLYEGSSMTLLCGESGHVNGSERVGWILPKEAEPLANLDKGRTSFMHNLRFESLSVRDSGFYSCRHRTLNVVVKSE